MKKNLTQKSKYLSYGNLDAFNVKISTFSVQRSSAVAQISDWND